MRECGQVAEIKTAKKVQTEDLKSRSTIMSTTQGHLKPKATSASNRTMRTAPWLNPTTLSRWKPLRVALRNTAPPADMYSCTHQKHRARIFTETVLIIALYWKPPKCPGTVECINKSWHFYTVKYCLAMWMEDLQLHLKRWLNLINILICEGNRKSTSFMIPHI